MSKTWGNDIGYEFVDDYLISIYISRNSNSIIVPYQHHYPCVFVVAYCFFLPPNRFVFVNEFNTTLTRLTENQIEQLLNLHSCPGESSDRPKN